MPIIKRYPMRFSTFVHSIALGCTLLGFAACKDKTDKEPPRVTIQKPYENQTFQTLDTIWVEASITDNEQLEWVVIQLLDAQYKTLSISKTVNASGSSYHLATEFFIDGPELESGTYYIAVRASDGENIGSAYVAVGISAIPREVEGHFAVTHENGQTGIWQRGTGDGAYELIHTQYDDFGGAALNYRKNILGVASRTDGPAVFYDTNEWESVLIIPGVAGGLPYFTGMRYNPGTGRTFLWKYDGDIMVFDDYVQQVNTFDVPDGYTPVDVFDLGDRHYVVDEQIAGPNYTLKTYSQAGLLLSSLNVNGRCKMVSRKSNDELYLWIDGVDGAELKILNQYSLLLGSPYSRPGTDLYDVAEMSDGVFALLTSDGLLVYEYSSGNTIVVSMSLNAPGTIAYDDIAGQFHVVQNNSIHRVAYNGNIVHTFTFPQKPVYIAVDYTR